MNAMWSPTGAQIERDLEQLSKITDCVRTYSVDFGLDRVPEMASKHGLKVLLGVWISGKPERNTSQIAIGVALAKKYPDVVRAVIVGLLHPGEAWDLGHPDDLGSSGGPEHQRCNRGSPHTREARRRAKYPVESRHSRVW